MKARGLLRKKKRNKQTSKFTHEQFLYLVKLVEKYYLIKKNSDVLQYQVTCGSRAKHPTKKPIEIDFFVRKLTFSASQ